MVAFADPVIVAYWRGELVCVGTPNQTTWRGVIRFPVAAKRRRIPCLSDILEPDRLSVFEQLESEHPPTGGLVPRYRRTVTTAGEAIMPEYVPIITAMVAVFISIFAARREWRFGRPDALQKYEKLVDELVTSNADLIKRVECLEVDNRRIEEENAANKRRIRELDEELEDYRLGVVILITQMESANLAPKWKPRAKRNTGELKAKS